MKRLKVVFVCVFMLLLGACGQSELTWQEHYDLGMQYLMEGNYEEAILSFTVAIEIDPKLAKAYIGRGDAYVLWGEADGEVMTEKNELALTDYLHAIELDAENADTYLKAAEVYLTLGNLEAAKELLRTGYDITQSEVLLQKLEELEMPDEITVLTRQAYERYSDEGDVTYGYKIYEYNDNGYMIHNEGWNRWEISDNGWEQTDYTDWSYDNEMDIWIRTSWGKYVGERMNEEKNRQIGTSSDYTVGSNGDTCITMDPYPLEKRETVYNEDFEEGEVVDWYSAKYTYDENGNAIHIESYSKDGVLLGVCDLEYAVIDLKK